MGAYWVKRAGQWFYAAANVIKPRGVTTDRVVLGASDQAAATTDYLSVDSGSEAVRAAIFRGHIQAQGGLVLLEISANLTCTYLTSGTGTASAMGFYMKNNQFVVAHQCGANGQIRYLTITLDGLSCAWVQSATAP